MLTELKVYYSYLPRRVTKAFTLAEVLVTLLIIGVIASLTIPGLIANTNKAELVAKLKKEQSVLMQAFNLVALDAGGSITMDSNFNTSTGDTATDMNAMNEFANKMNVIKSCGSGTGCWYASPIKYLDGHSDTPNLETSWSSKFGKAILADGTSIMIDMNADSCTTNIGSLGTPLANSGCGYIILDINGASGPNTYGRDVFLFWITKTGIYPAGTFGDSYSCSINNSTWNNTNGCAGKVLTEGAMNY